MHGASPCFPGFDTRGHIYIVEHSHSDIAWGSSIQGEAQVRNRNLDGVLKTMRQDPTFKWTVECVLYLENWLSANPDAEPEILRLMREGRLDCGASYTQPMEDCQYNELLARQMYVGKRWFEQRCPGIELNTVLNQDAPLRGHQTQQVYARAGVKHLKGSRMNTPGFFRWCSPDGSYLLAWFQDGYWGKPKIDTVYIANMLKTAETSYRKYKLPPILGITWGHDYNDPFDFSTIISQWNGTATASNLPSVSYGTFADVLRNVEKIAAKLPELHGGVPNWWIYENWPSHTKTMQWQRTAGKLLPMAETFQTVKSSIQGNFAEYPTAVLNRAWNDAVYACHTMVPKHAPAPDAIMGEKYRQAAETGQREMLNAMKWIAERVRPAGRGVPVIVFNGLSWPRTDPVTVNLPSELGNKAFVQDDKGRMIPCQIIGTNKLVFVADKVPSIGYSTYYLSAADDQAIPVAFPLGQQWTTPFESDFYKVTPGEGGLASIVDKEFGKELLATNRWLGGEWTTFATKAMGACEGYDGNPHPEMFSDRSSMHRPAWTCEETGPVYVRWGTSTMQSTNCQVKLTVTLYLHVKRLDMAVTVLGNNKAFGVEQRLMFPIKTAVEEIAYEVPFGVVEPGNSEPFVFVKKGAFTSPAAVPSEPREVQNWVSVTGDGVGITIGTPVGAFAFRDFGPKAQKSPMLSPILLACTKGLEGNLLQPGDYSFEFSLYSHPVGYRNGYRLGIQSQNPLVSVLPGKMSSTVLLPASISFFTPQSDHVVVSTVKKAEDDNAVVMRLFDLEGKSGDVRVQSLFKVLDARVTDLLERKGRSAIRSPESFTVPIRPWGIETAKVRLEKLEQE